MKCPACETDLSQEEMEEVTLSVCGTCRGVWLSSQSQKEIPALRPEGFRLNEMDSVNRLCGHNGSRREIESRGFSCPACTKPMTTVSYHYGSGIVVDRCAGKCGFWIDAEEMEKVQVHAETWQDRLEAHRDRFEVLADALEEDMRHEVDALETAEDPSRLRFISWLIRGVVRFE